ncbi:hypothetical protein DMA11_23005 [Marinilabiliaceae bacterium JC017]|nr:hypothetical protein DMA11_23005 [Marinilabiliaceae bacterium JC017]
MDNKVTSNTVSLLFLIVFFLITACKSSQTQIHIPSDTELEQKRALLSISDLAKHNREMQFLRPLSLRKIRHIVSQNSKKNEELVGVDLKNFKDSYSDMLKRYDLGEESELSRRVDLNCTRNDTVYMNFVKKGHVFGQHFKKDTNIIYIIREPDLNTSNSISLSTGKTLSAGVSFDFHTYPNYELSKVYFSNGDIEENVSSDWCGFFNTTCHIGRQMPIDSLQVHFTLNSIFEYDTLVLTADDIGKTYNNITLHELKNGFLALEGDCDKIIEIECRNDSGMYIQDENGFTDCTPYRSCNANDKYVEKNKLLEEKIDAIDNKEDALRLIENSILDEYVNPEDNLCEKYQFYKGNIKEVVVYYIVKRDNIVFDVMFRAANPNQQIFTNGFDDKTEILNRNGKPVLIVPVGELNFATSRGYYEIDRGFENVHYLECYDENYHFNFEKKKVTKMKSYGLRGALSSNLVKVWDNENRNLLILDNNMIAIHDSTYSDIELNGTLIIAKRQEGYSNWYNSSSLKCHIYDSKGQKVLPYYVSDVAPHYNGIYRVVVNDKIGYMDASGKWLIEPKYDVLDIDFDRRDKDMKYLLQIVSLNGKIGLIDLDNNLKPLIPCKYTDLNVIPETNGQYYIVSTSYNYYGVIDIDGNIIRPFETISYYDLFDEVLKAYQKP